MDPWLLHHQSSVIAEMSQPVGKWAEFLWSRAQLVSQVGVSPFDIYDFQEHGSDGVTEWMGNG
jgi:hypothetical protein